jgi:hypothetical protein
MTKRNLFLTAVASAITVTLAVIFAPDHTTQARPAATPASSVTDTTTDIGTLDTRSSASELSGRLLSAADLPGSGWSTIADVGSASTKCGSDSTEPPTAIARVAFGYGQLDPATWIEAEPIIVESLFRYVGDVHQWFASLQRATETCLPSAVASPDVDTVELLPLTVPEVGDERWSTRLHVTGRRGDSELVMDIVLVRVDATVIQLLHITAFGPVDPALTSFIAERAVDRIDG